MNEMIPAEWNKLLYTQRFR
ncbi:hypothetical protein BVY13_17770 [Bacillus amyloliquefaciens]|nr:hypothetical protein [Bacillus amyloliquefaciens]PLT48791.1 hypothetical protein BVY13_17770 [Bacillus amyloliquefaciens]